MISGTVNILRYGCSTITLARLVSLLMIWVMLYVAGCRRIEKDDHPEYYKKYALRLASVYDRSGFISVLDSFQADLHRYPAGVGDWLKFYQVKTTYYLTARDFEKIFPLIDTTILIIKDRLQEERYMAAYGTCLINRSECYLAMGDYDEGMKYLLEAKLFLSQNSNNACALLESNRIIGSLFYRQARYRFAIAHYLIAVENEQRCNKDTISQFAYTQALLDNVGMAYRELGMNDSAMYFFNKALQYISENEHRLPQKAEYIAVARSVIYGNMAKIKRKQQQYADAEDLDLRSIKGLGNIYNNLAIDASFELANTYIEWNKLDAAATILKRLDSLGDFHFQSDILDNAMLWNKSMKDLWAKKKDTAKAYIYNNRYLLLRDSIDKQAKTNILRDMAAEMENKEKVTRNEVLEKEGQKKSLQLLVVSLLVTIALATGVFVWNNFNRTARYEESLEVLNLELKLQNEDIQQAMLSLQQIQSENIKIRRMAAHDLKNPLGGIRNLLYSFIKKQLPGELKDKMKEMDIDCSSCIVIINGLIKEEERTLKESTSS